VQLDILSQPAWLLLECFSQWVSLLTSSRHSSDDSVALPYLWWYLWERAHFFWNLAQYHATSSYQWSIGKLACYTLSWSLALDENHCWSSRPDRLWGNCSHMTCLTSGSISLWLYGEDSCEKASFWLNNHSCPNQTRNDTQEAGDPKGPFPRSIMAIDGGESLLLCQSHVLFHSNEIMNNNGRWYKLDFPSWSVLSHAVDLVGSSLNYSSSWPWLENHFHNEVIFMPQHQYVRGLLDSAQKNF
jgi:hypothetical protein